MIRRTLQGGLVAAVSLLAFLPTAAGAATAGAAAPQAPGATARHHRTHPARHHHIHRFTVPGVPLRSSTHRVAAATGRVVTHGARLNVRSGPGTGYRVIGHRHAHRTVRLACRTHGSWVRGNHVWYRLPHHRGYVSARYVRPYRILPWC